MADSHSSRVPLSPAELVGSRIDENRLFEARFLFQKFCAEIDPAVGEKLRRQLEGRIARAEKTFARGELLERAGKLEQAGKVYADLAVMVLDYPSLAEARQRVELAIRLGPLEPVNPPEPEIPVAGPSPSVISSEGSTDTPVSGTSFFQRRKVVLLLVFSLFVVLLGAVSFRFFFRAQSGPPVVFQPVVQAQPEDVPRAKEPERRLSVGRPLPEPAAALPDVAEPARKNSAETVAEEIETAEKEAVVSAAPVVEERPGAREASPAPQEEPGSGQIPEAKVSMPVAPKEEAERAVGSPVRKVLPEAAPLSGTNGQVVAGRTVQEQKNSSSDAHGVPEIPKTMETISRKGGSAVPVEHEERAVVEDGDLPGSTVEPSRKSEKRAALLNDDGTYTVQSGDSLGSIALKLYGASWKWDTLYQLNRDRLSSPAALRVGQRLLVNEKNIPESGEGKPVGE